MNCPFCGAETELGYIQSDRPFFWSRKKRLIKIPASPEDVGVSEAELTGHYAEAFCCRACNKLIAAGH